MAKQSNQYEYTEDLKYGDGKGRFIILGWKKSEKHNFSSLVKYRSIVLNFHFTVTLMMKFET